MSYEKISETTFKETKQTEIKYDVNIILRKIEILEKQLAGQKKLLEEAKKLGIEIK